MSRSANAYEIESENPLSVGEDETEDAVFTKATSRLEPFRLEAALVASALHANDDDGATPAAGPEQHGRLIDAAFWSDDDDDDDDLAIDVPVPSAADDDPRASGTYLMDDVAAEKVDLPAVTPQLATTLEASPVDESQRSPSTVASLLSRVSHTIPPETARAVREARAVARTQREAEAQMRRIVLGIWGAAVILAGLLAFFAARS